MKIVVVLPTYNEKENIENLIKTMEIEIFPSIKGHRMHILVVDDNSPDGTASIVKKLMRQWKNISLLLGPKRGLGAAYLRGMDYATERMKAQVIISMDTDGQHDPKKIPHFLKNIDVGYDMVIGSRYVRGGSVAKNWKLHRKIISKSANVLIGLSLNEFRVREWTTSYRAQRSRYYFELQKYIVKKKFTQFL